MPFATSIALAVSLALSGSASAAPAKMSLTMPAAQTVEEYVRSYYADAPILVEIAKCESRFRQFDSNGKLLKNPDSSAIGVMQVMASIHTGYADRLGLDITTLQGNLAYAKYLYEEQGTRPWDASGACWRKSGTYKELARK